MICKKFKKTVAVTIKFLDETLDSALTIAQQITNEVAKVIGNPLFQFLVSQLPAGVNTEAILKKIEEVLTVTGDITACKDLTGVDKINCLMQGLNLLPKKERNSILHRLNAELTATLDGQRFEQVVYDSAAQLNYFNEVIASGRPLKNGDTTERPVKIVSMPVEDAIKTLSQVHNTFAQPIREVPQIATQTPNAIQFTAPPAVTDLPGYKTPDELRQTIEQQGIHHEPQPTPNAW